MHGSKNSFEQHERLSGRGQGPRLGLLQTHHRQAVRERAREFKWLPYSTHLHSMPLTVAARSQRAYRAAQTRTTQPQARRARGVFFRHIRSPPSTARAASLSSKTPSPSIWSAARGPSPSIGTVTLLRSGYSPRRFQRVVSKLWQAGDEVKQQGPSRGSRSPL